MPCIGISSTGTRRFSPEIRAWLRCMRRGGAFPTKIRRRSAAMLGRFLKNLLHIPSEPSGGLSFFLAAAVRAVTDLVPDPRPGLTPRKGAAARDARLGRQIGFLAHLG